MSPSVLSPMAMGIDVSVGRSVCTVTDSRPSAESNQWSMPDMCMDHKHVASMRSKHGHSLHGGSVHVADAHNTYGASMGPLSPLLSRPGSQSFGSQSMQLSPRQSQPQAGCGSSNSLSGGGSVQLIHFRGTGASSRR